MIHQSKQEGSDVLVYLKWVGVMKFYIHGYPGSNSQSQVAYWGRPVENVTSKKKWRTALNQSVAQRS